MRPLSLLVKVPGTVGNFGGAMNCAALAIDAMFNVKVTPRTDGRVGIRYFGEDGDRVPRDRSNLVVRAMEAALHLKGLEFTGADFEVYSSVPVGVGLGSSTAAVLAGLIAADRLYALRLNEKTVFDLARIYEPRPDNLCAAWYGGFVACTKTQHSPVLRRTFAAEDFVLSVVTPESRKVLPSTNAESPPKLATQDQPLNIERAQVLAELFAGWSKNIAAGQRPVQSPAFEKVVPGFEDIFDVTAAGVMGVFVCGSGPAVGILCPKRSDEAIRSVRQRFRDFGTQSTFGLFRPANAGALELNDVTPHIAFPTSRLTVNRVDGLLS